MAIRQRLRRMIDRILGPDDLLPEMVRPQDVAMQGRYAQQPTAAMLKRYQGGKWVAVAVRRNSSAAAANPLRVYRETGRAKSAFRGRPTDRATLRRRSKAWGPAAHKALAQTENIEEITDPMHPLVSLLSRPWPDGSGFELIELTEMHLSLAGDAFWAKLIGDQGYPIEVWPLGPQYVRIVPRREESMVDYYEYGRDAAVENKYGRDAIVHFKRPNPCGDPFRGMPDLAACASDADLSVAYTEFSLALLDQGAHPSALVVAKSGTTKQQLEEIERRMNAKYTGVSKAGRMYFMTGDIETTILDSGSKADKPFLQGEQSVREVIAGAFDVPIALLTLDQAALATAKVAIPQWQKQAILPRCRRLEDRINESLVPDFYEPLGDDSLFVGFDDPVDQDTAADATRAQVLFSANIINRNEARIMAGEDPLDGPEGEVFAFDQQMQLAEATKPTLPGGRDEAKVLFVTDERGAKDGLTAKDVLALLPQFIDKGAPAPLVTAATPDAANGTDKARARSTAEPRTVPLSEYNRHHAKDDRREPLSAELQEAMRRAFIRLASEVNRQVLAGVDDPVRQAMDNIGFESIIEQESGPALESLFADGYAIGAGEVAGRAAVDPFSVVNTEALEFLSRYRIKLAKSVSDTTEERLRTALKGTIESGAGIPEQVQAVREVMDDRTLAGAEAIARTETARAQLQGREAAWEKSGVVEGKEWLLSGDPCPLCIAMAEEFNNVPLGEPMLAVGDSISVPGGTDARTGQAYDGFTVTNDYAPIDGPPAHPNCRCGLGARFKPVEVE